MFGFDAAKQAATCVDEEECSTYIPDVGYWTQKKIVTELQDATLFPDKDAFGIKGFGTPKQWLDFINSDKSLNHGYKLHLVKTCLTADDFTKKTGLAMTAEAKAAAKKPKQKLRAKNAMKAAKKMPMP